MTRFNRINAVPVGPSRASSLLQGAAISDAAFAFDLAVALLWLQICRPFPRGRTQALRRGHRGKDAAVAAPGPECAKTWKQTLAMISQNLSQGSPMKRFIQGEHRGQSTLLPESLDDYVSDTNPVRVVDVFVDELDLITLGFESAVPAET
ncbi:hypothetical protein AEQ67_09695, partial [Pseudomonas sp. RIT-PI-q]